MRQILLPIVMAFFVVGCAGKAQISPYADYGPYPSEYEEIVKDFLSDQLFDPYSAHYRFAPPRGMRERHPS